MRIHLIYLYNYFQAITGVVYTVTFDSLITSLHAYHGVIEIDIRSLDLKGPSITRIFYSRIRVKSLKPSSEVLCIRARTTCFHRFSDEVTPQQNVGDIYSTVDLIAIDPRQIAAHFYKYTGFICCIIPIILLHLKLNGQVT